TAQSVVEVQERIELIDELARWNSSSTEVLYVASRHGESRKVGVGDIAPKRIREAQTCNVESLAIHDVRLEITRKAHAGVKHHPWTDHPGVACARAYIAALEFVLAAGWISCRETAALAIKGARRVAPVIPSVAEKHRVVLVQLMIHARRQTRPS